MASNDFHDGIDVCVGNWGYYSEGELRDTWMHLPMDPDDGAGGTERAAKL